MTLIQIALLIILYSGFLIITYPEFARKRGLAVGAILANDSSIVRTLGGLGMFFSLVAVFFYFDWYIALISIIGIFITTYLTTMLLKQATQFICILGIFIGFALAIIHYIF